AFPRLELISALDLGTVPWSEVPVSLKQALGLAAGDKGIDSLALNLTVAVQAKDYTNGHSVQLDFDFLATRSLLGQYCSRRIVATNSSTRLPQLWDELAGAEHRRYSAEKLEAWLLRAREWSEQQPGSEVRSTPSSTSPRWPHQGACLMACRKFLAGGPKQRDFFVQITTGGGKSLIMADLLAELDQGGRACVIVPKLDLMEQVAQLFEAMALPGISRVGTRYMPDMGARIFVCVRNSAWKLAHLDFNILLLDEAHHYEPLPADMEDISGLALNSTAVELIAVLASLKMKNLSANHPRLQASTVLNLQAQKRLFFSGTLRRSSPDFNFGLRAGVKEGVISDYTIIVPFTTAGDPKPSLVGLIQDLPTARRILAFCNTVREAKQFAQLLNAAGVRAGHYNGHSSRPQRTKMLEDFEKGPSRSGVRVLVTVDVLSEGADLPMADTCLFVEPRKGLRVRQCVGRVLRKHPQKVDALVISPPITQEADGGLLADDELVRLLSELAAADDELRKSLVENSFGRVSIVDRRSNRTDVSPVLAQEEAATLLSTKVYPQALAAERSAWDDGINHLKAYKQEHGDVVVPQKHVAENGLKLGQWVDQLRQTRKGQNNCRLYPTQIEQLDSLGFLWDARPSLWDAGINQLKAYKQEHGDVVVPRRHVADDGLKLGQWVKTLRRTRRARTTGRVYPTQIEQLDSLGFLWDARLVVRKKGV
ncbi:unnamed protein product, partial [Polarella glacialis]